MGVYATKRKALISPNAWVAIAGTTDITYPVGFFTGTTTEADSETAEATAVAVRDFNCPDPAGGAATCRVDYNQRLPAFEDASYNSTTNDLTKVGAFAGYEHKANDVVTITGGTGATPGEYVISSKTDDDTVVLATDPAAGTPTDISGQVTWRQAITVPIKGPLPLRVSWEKGGLVLPGPVRFQNSVGAGLTVIVTYKVLS